MTNLSTHPKPLPVSSSGPAGISIAVAKANFSSLISGVETKRAPITILRRGVPVAQLIPVPSAIPFKLGGSMAGTARELGDIVSPIGIEWTVSDDIEADLRDDG